jgi:hypothetical protein
MDECTKCGSRESERHMQQANKLRIAELEAEVERLKKAIVDATEFTPVDLGMERLSRFYRKTYEEET